MLMYSSVNLCSCEMFRMSGYICLKLTTQCIVFIFFKGTFKNYKTTCVQHCETFCFHCLTKKTIFASIHYNIIRI